MQPDWGWVPALYLQSNTLHYYQRVASAKEWIHQKNSGDNRETQGVQGLLGTVATSIAHHVPDANNGLAHAGEVTAHW